MFIHDLDYLEKIDDGETIVGGAIDNEALFLDFSGGQLTLKQGPLVLFSGAVSQPKSITISLQDAGVPFAFSSSVTEVINGVVKTTWTLSTQAPEVIGRLPRRRSSLS
ncbi:hypothetical protein [Thermoleptolyngbya sp.]|jgi:hypothetical protein